jgi:NADH-quinone oxidoreductase subunit I
MWSALRSIWIVFKHLFMRRLTVQYPEMKRRLPPRWRGRIVLTRDARGEERCVACYLCAAACPPSCISLQSATREDGRRYPAFFRINFSRCIFCGFCEEACPTYAIQLTPDYEMSEYVRQNLVYEKEDLLVDGQGKRPGYDFYEEAGVKPSGQKPAGPRPVPEKVDPRSLLP